MDSIFLFRRSGSHDQNRKRRADRSTADDQSKWLCFGCCLYTVSSVLVSPSHSSTGRPSSSRDQNPSVQQRRGGGHDDSNSAYDNTSGRNYSSQSRRPYVNNASGPNRSNDYSRGSRSKYESRGGHFQSNRPHFDGQQSRYDQYGHASTSGGDRGAVDHRERSKRPTHLASSSSREMETEDNFVRERSPKRPKLAPAEQGAVDKNGPGTYHAGQ